MLLYALFGAVFLGAAVAPVWAAGSIVLGTTAQPTVASAGPNALLSLTRFTFKNSGTEAVTINGIDLSQVGSASDSVIATVYVWDENSSTLGSRTGSGIFSSVHTTTVTLGLSIPAGTTRTLTVGVRMAASVASQAGKSVGLSLVAVHTSAAVAGALPVVGIKNIIPGSGPLPQCTMSTTPSTITKGGSFTLKWSSINATSAYIPGSGLGSVSPTGQKNLIPIRSARFTGTFSGPGGQTVCQAIIVVLTENGTPTTVVDYDDPEYDNISGSGGSGSAGSSVPPVSVSLAPGASGSQVTALQEWLIAHGYNIPSVEDGSAPFGVYGNETKLAVAEWQRDAGIPVTDPSKFGFYEPVAATGSTGASGGSGGPASTGAPSSTNAPGGADGPGGATGPGSASGADSATAPGSASGPGTASAPGSFGAPAALQGGSTFGGSPTAQFGQGSSQTSRGEDTGLVPCNGVDCQACHLVTLAQKIINFILGLAIPLAAAMFAYAGVLYFTSSVLNKIDKAKKVFFTVFVGFCIVAGAWLIIQTLLGIILNDSYKDWSHIECTADSRRPMDARIDQLLSIIPGLTNTTAPADVVVGQNSVGDGSIPITPDVNAGLGSYSCADSEAFLSGTQCITATGSTDAIRSSSGGISDAADRYYGANTSAGPDGGNLACAWAVNNVLATDNVPAIDGNSVAGMEQALRDGRGTYVDTANAQPGNIIVWKSGSVSHVGICQNVGCSTAISNSSSNASFTNISGSTFRGVPGRVYQVNK